ncbi:lysophosphatidic acid receptor 6-like [Trichomycterus rosablanca]|uniref:lysophosphatidic acid receptor 6-like n=1 Tax=Trichomycterus rosablanca TaxID=2290929 RepID=UPI002F359093
MNSTNNVRCSHLNTTGGNIAVPYPVGVTIAVLICLFLLLGLFLNIFSMWVFMYRIPEWRSGTFLQFHLAISDITMCPLAPFITAYYFLEGHWPFGNLLCRIKTVVLIVHLYGSILFLTLISVHRYVLVVYHSQNSRMKQKDFVKKLCAVVWVFLLVNGVVCGSVLDTSPVGHCTLRLSVHQEQNVEVFFVINFVLLIPGFLIPFTVSVFCYSCLARSVSGINVFQQKGQLIKRKSRKMVAVCLVIFGLCFMPMTVVRTIWVVVKKYFPTHCNLLLQVETAHYVSFILSSANCCLDPLIYCFASQNFTRAIQSSLRKIGIQSVRKNADDKIEHDSGLTTINNPTGLTLNRDMITTTHL